MHPHTVQINVQYVYYKMTFYPDEESTSSANHEAHLYCTIEGLALSGTRPTAFTLLQTTSQEPASTVHSLSDGQGSVRSTGAHSQRAVTKRRTNDVAFASPPFPTPISALLCSLSLILSRSLLFPWHRGSRRRRRAAAARLLISWRRVVSCKVGPPCFLLFRTHPASSVDLESR
jgi:hypothetical protein